MALAHMGLAYETVPTPYSGISGIGDGATRTVPVIEDSGRRVQDSFEIALYLESAYPGRPALFGSEGMVAAARFMEGWTFLALHPLVLRMILKDIHDALGESDKSYFRQSREARFGRSLEEIHAGVPANTAAFQRALDPVRRTLTMHEWLGGPSPRFSDYIVFGSLMWLRTIHGALPLVAEDGVHAWFERCLDLHGGLARNAPTARAA
jgi:glutathione S-transferase